MPVTFYSVLFYSAALATMLLCLSPICHSILSCFYSFSLLVCNFFHDFFLLIILEGGGQLFLFDRVEDNHQCGQLLEYGQLSVRTIVKGTFVREDICPRPIISKPIMFGPVGKVLTSRM